MVQVVVQLKDNEIDTTRTVLASSLLGDLVPICYGALTKAQFAYVSRFIPGTVWALQEGHFSVDTNARIARQVGSLLARCTLGLDSSAIVNRYIIPRLNRTIAKADMPDDLRKYVREFVKFSKDLESLPLALSHADVNSMNLILNENAEIVGLIDWELAQLLPVGMNAWCIVRLSFTNRNRVDYASEKTQPMAEAFWNGFVSSLPGNTQKNSANIVKAMKIGLIFDQFGEGYVPDPRDVAMTLGRLEWIENTFSSLRVADPEGKILNFLRQKHLIACA